MATCPKETPDVNTVPMPSTSSQWTKDEDLATMFSVLTPSESIATSQNMKLTEGYRTLANKNGNNTNNTSKPIYRPLALPQFLKVSASKLFPSTASLGSNLKFTRFNPSTLTFAFINGYVYPLDARPIIEFTMKDPSANTQMASSTANTLTLDFPYLVSQWNVREIQVRATFSNAVPSPCLCTVRLVPSNAHYMLGAKIWMNSATSVNPVALRFESGHSAIPVQRHYNLDSTESDETVATVANGFKLGYQFLSATPTSHAGAWVTHSSPLEANPSTLKQLPPSVRKTVHVKDKGNMWFQDNNNKCYNCATFHLKDTQPNSKLQVDLCHQGNDGKSCSQTTKKLSVEYITTWGTSVIIGTKLPHWRHIYINMDGSNGNHTLQIKGKGKPSKELTLHDGSCSSTCLGQHSCH
jgi:hypothetical protein